MNNASSTVRNGRSVVKDVEVIDTKEASEKADANQQAELGMLSFEEELTCGMCAGVFIDVSGRIRSVPVELI